MIICFNIHRWRIFNQSERRWEHFCAGRCRQIRGHQRIVKTVADRYDRIDIVVCSAGIYNPLYALDDETYDCAHIDHYIDVNLKGSIYAVKTCLPYLKKSSAGRVILISSITGPHTGFDESSLYGATKSGQVSFYFWISFLVLWYQSIFSRWSRFSLRITIQQAKWPHTGFDG